MLLISLALSSNFFVYSVSVLMCTTRPLFLLILLMLFVHHLFCFTCRLCHHMTHRKYVNRYSIQRFV